MYSSLYLLLSLQTIQYEVGDVLEVLPSQNPAAVDAFIQRCNLDPESLITVSPSIVLADNGWSNLVEQMLYCHQGRDLFCIIACVLRTSPSVFCTIITVDNCGICNSGSNNVTIMGLLSEHKFATCMHSKLAFLGILGLERPCEREQANSEWVELDSSILCSFRGTTRTAYLPHLALSSDLD